MSKILVLLKNKKTYIALTATILIGYLLYLIQLNIGYPVTIRVLDGDNLSQNPVSLTGVMVDSVWYAPSRLFPMGDWEVLNDVMNLKAKDNSSVKIMVPGVKDIVFTFKSNEANNIEISNFDQVYQFTLSPENSDDHTTYINIPATGHLFQKYLLNAVIGAIFCVSVCLGLFKFFSKNRAPYNSVAVCIGAVIVSFISLYFSSLATTPFISINKYVWGGFDSQTFHFAGKIIANGLTMYADFFDHKGPIVFFLYAISDVFLSKWPLFILQVVFLSITLFFSYKITSKLSNKFAGILTIGITIFYFLSTFGEGLLSEEINLPFLMVSMYFLICYLVNAEKIVHHDHKLSIFYGITIGISFCIRATNCVYILVIIFCIIIYLILKKEYQNVIQNLIAGTCGFLIVLVPFIIYFFLKGALYDFIFGTILFNIQYTLQDISHSLSDWLFIILFLLPVIISVLLAFERKNNKLLLASIVTSGCVYMYFQMSLSSYPHYYVLTIPYISIAVGFLFGNQKNDSKIDRYKFGYYGLVLLMGVAFLTYNTEPIVSQFQATYASKIGSNDTEYNEAIILQGSIIPEEDRNAVAAYSVSPDWFLINNIYPCYNDISGQDWRLYNSPELYEVNLDNFSSLEAKWIVVRNEISQSDIKSIIDENYILVDERSLNNDELKLYKLNI